MPRNSSGLRKRRLTEIQSRGRVPIFCGGTGLYFKAFLSGLGEAPATNPELRAELEAASFEALLHELRERDPAAYEKIDKQNPRRVIRAVEVIRLTWQKVFRATRRVEGAERRPNQNKFILLHAPGGGHARAHQRPRGRDVRARAGGGDARLAPARPRRKQDGDAGYRLPAGGGISARRTPGLTETIELVKSRTRQFAKRQLTWFRRHGNMEWMELKQGDPPGDCAQKICELV